MGVVVGAGVSIVGVGEREMMRTWGWCGCQNHCRAAESLQRRQIMSRSKSVLSSFLFFA